MQVLGIDVGGSGIKGAPVNTKKGVMLAPRKRIPTPESAKPKPMARVVAEIARHFDWKGPIGCGFPSPIQGGTVMTAANIHQSWVGVDASALFSAATGCPVHMLNDADAAGMAEMRFGAGHDRKDVVLLVTIGTGLGTVMFTNGRLVPNLELGHIEIECEDAELNASDAARKRENMSWKEWAERLDVYLQTLEKLLWPDLIILGGGVIKKQDKFIPLLTVKTPVVPAELGNEAGIVGAAIGAEKAFKESIE